MPEENLSAPTHEAPLEMEETKRVLKSLTCGAIAGACAKTTIAPLDRTKIMFQGTISRYYSLIILMLLPVTSRHFTLMVRGDANYFRNFTRIIQNAGRLLAELYKTDGFIQLWRGNGATLLRVMPYAGIQFAAHDKIKRFLLRPGERCVLRMSVDSSIDEQILII